MKYNTHDWKGFLINDLISDLNYKSYLELGVSVGESWKLIYCENKIGVDPTQGGTHRKTSDDFFIDNTKNFDVIFIDGLHTYEQCQRDCINSLKFLNPRGVILFHDF